MNYKLRIMNHGLVAKKILAIFGFLILAFSLVINPALANGEEVKRGADIWQKFSSGQIKCENLTDEQFENLGEFFMERMAGSSQNHEKMDEQMEKMMGKEGVDQMHIVMGKRISGCQPDATAQGVANNMMGFPFSQKGGGWSMMGPGMMGWGGGVGSGWMMGQAGGVLWIWALLSWATWILVIVALITFIRWMWKKGDKK